MSEYRLVADETMVSNAVQEMAQKIAMKFSWGWDLIPLTFLCNLDGGMFFFTDLLRRMPTGLPFTVSCCKAVSFKDNENQGHVDWILPPDGQVLRGCSVIIVEDIMDSGRTMKALFEKVSEFTSPKNIYIATLVYRPKNSTTGLVPDWHGFKLENKDFLVGCGMDNQGLFRHLPYIVARKEKE